MIRLEARCLSTGYGNHAIGEHISFTLRPREVLCLLGPNGSGKTTLFRTLLGILPPIAGEVRAAERPLSHFSRRDLATLLAYVPQAHAGLFAFTVEDVVLMGRTARRSLFASPSGRDRTVALKAMERLGILHLADRVYTRVSGGERQLALVARALAQEADVLILDEPTASLDFGNQIRVLGEIRRLRAAGFSILMSTHQPEHALDIADRVMLLKDGRIWAEGPPHETATAERLASLYSADIQAVASRLPRRERAPQA